ncbi:unnamed protein product [Ilex paraguariensis]|uniref:Uncharacterized protein n=1 Tax=Ilex paraguariensis TaxID=185542 RepID=A0ABC8SUP2_9AQUA
MLLMVSFKGIRRAIPILLVICGHYWLQMEMQLNIFYSDEYIFTAMGFEVGPLYFLKMPCQYLTNLDYFMLLINAERTQLRFFGLTKQTQNFFILALPFERYLIEVNGLTYSSIRVSE